MCLTLFALCDIMKVYGPFGLVVLEFTVEFRLRRNAKAVDVALQSELSIRQKGVMTIPARRRSLRKFIYEGIFKNEN